MIEKLTGCLTVSNKGVLRVENYIFEQKNKRSGHCRILLKRQVSKFLVKIRGRRLSCSKGYIHVGILIELYTTKILMMQKGNLGAEEFEPTPPKRLVSKTSALDHSATLPDALNIGPKHCKSKGAYFYQYSPIRETRLI